MIAPLLADLGDILKIFFFLVFILGPVLIQLFKGAGGKPKARNIQQQRPAAAPAARPPARVEDEIEAFLRQARAKQPANPPPPEPVAAELVQPKPRRLTQSTPLASARRTTQKPKREPAQRMGRGVRDHVESHMAEGRVSEHASHLGEGIGNSDERFESRLKSKFDHDLGDLQSTSETPQDDLILEGTDADVWSEQKQPDPNETAERIAELLRRPDGMRDAVVLSEIFNPPHQW